MAQTNSSNHIKNQKFNFFHSKISRIGVLTALVWSIVVGLSLWSNIAREYDDVAKGAAFIAKANLDKDQAIRRWVSGHGGLYGKVSEQLKPSPYLSHIPMRDIDTPLGKMTLLNPAYILRLMMDEYASLYGVKGRINFIL